MELPNYSRQLMQQLQALRKECQFCDCTILVEGVPHPAHKVVLAASSLLFKSLLESSDSISIDTAVMTSQEFSSLLDMVYMGRLPPGKHNFTRVIAAADSLQMFDVAVGCKNILNNLMKQAQPKGPQLSKEEHPDLQSNTTSCGREEPTELGSSEGQGELALIQGASDCPGLCEDGVKDPARGSDDLKANAKGSSCDGASGESSRVDEEGTAELLSQKRDEILKTLQELQPWIKTLCTWGALPTAHRQIMLECFVGDEGVDVVFQRLLERLKDDRSMSAQTFLTLLEQVKSLQLDLDMTIVHQSGPELKGKSGSMLERSSGYSGKCALKLSDYLTSVNNISELLMQAADKCEKEALKEVLLECKGEKTREQVVKRLLSTLSERGIEESSLLELLQETGESVIDQQEEPRNTAAAQVDVLLKHRDLILQTFSEITDLEKAAGCSECDKDNVRGFLQSCQRTEGEAESMEQVLDRVLSRDVQHVPPLCCLLTMSQQSFPQLSPLTEELKLNKAELVTPSQVVGSEEEKEEEEEGERRRTALRRKGVVVSYSCQWCNKSFDFKCRLMRHRKRCALSPGKVQRCTDCTLVFPSLTALQQHCSQAHGAPPAKKKKTQPVACELCSKTFKHPSGLLYHRRTEHLEERPYACEECGAKFAANSSLKNHMRLHTGEKPYQCKHCDMSFAVAAALSYHTKKKHAEGKMYSCQYCSSTFAQSIELTRHVRTHTGDKPYVCRECGKGFRQANGLSVHLQSFHNVAEPHDCQKCRVSFGSLDELREHIQEVHPKELHQCPECSRILSTAAQLEKHMSVHDGSKPYSCKSCHKSYQTLSGLWYHNRTTHPDVVTTEGSRSLSHPLRCKICDKAFCNRSSLFKHHITKHPETRSAEGLDEKEAQAEGSLWRCVYCACAASSEEELQQHVSSEHVSQQGSVFGCVVCSLTFPTEAEFQHHFLTTHVQVIQEEEPTQMVIHTQDTSAPEAEQMAELDQSQVDCSQQVFVALSDGGESAAGSEIVAVNMEDLLSGRVTLICEENP
ncbi:zinc finger and BTB domain-containing protein 40 [Salminus brasiliensis]|uniref:zinc finger and BTB domain-containing protein 40 n=1 Tax=Salminus brasiliensis TaxID=930266 RepID=UPI003B838E14